MAARPIARAVFAAAIMSFGLSGAALAQDVKYAKCSAAERVTPTLNRSVFPTATFEMAERRVGQERGPGGEAIPLFMRYGVDKVHLAEGVELEVSQGGCDSHSNAYRFRLPKLEHDIADSGFWIGKAVELIGLVEPGNSDSMVDLAAMKRALRTRMGNARAAGFRDSAIDGVLPYGGGEDRGRITAAYLVVVNQRAEGTTVSVTYLIGPL